VFEPAIGTSRSDLDDVVNMRPSSSQCDRHGPDCR
jgi:hypothetical protein